MEWFEALILGIVQGLTEFLPVSSSGHIEIGKVILNIELKEDIRFAIVVHGATVLSTILVFWKNIKNLLQDLFRFQWNESTQYITKLLYSIIPVAIIGIFFKDQIKQLFTGNILLVGFMLLITASFLTFTYFRKNGNKNISFTHSLIIGIAQAFAVIPGISRSGATIATGLFLGNKKEEVARFSFLMVLLPIIAANILDIISTDKYADLPQVNNSALIIGFFSAFISGFLACKWMIKIVNKGKLIYFGIYCFIIGLLAIIFA